MFVKIPLPNKLLFVVSNTPRATYHLIHLMVGWYNVGNSPSIGHLWDQKKQPLRKIKNGMFLYGGDHD